LPVILDKDELQVQKISQDLKISEQKPHAQLPKNLRSLNWKFDIRSKAPATQYPKKHKFPMADYLRVFVSFRKSSWIQTLIEDLNAATTGCELYTVGQTLN
jgi:hypothetical protein